MLTCPQSCYCSKPSQDALLWWILIRSMLKLQSTRGFHFTQWTTMGGRRLQRLIFLTYLFGLSTRYVLVFLWTTCTVRMTQWFQRQDWQFHGSTTSKDFILRNLQPAYEASSDPATRPCLGSLTPDSLLSQRSAPVFRATYWCNQKCIYPSQEMYTKYQEDLWAKKEALKQYKGAKGRPTKVHNLFELSTYISWLFIKRLKQRHWGPRLRLKKKWRSPTEL